MCSAPELLLAGWLALQPQLDLENSLIAGYDQHHHFSAYNRLRAELGLESTQWPNLYSFVSLNNESLYRSHPHDTSNEPSVHRAMVQYRGTRHYWSLGRQRVPLGVGRIWNPIDLFNPVNNQAIEMEERPGTDSLRYEYSLAELAQYDMTVAENQAAVRLKGFWHQVDLAMVGLRDTDQDLTIIGWEMAGQLLDTGVEMRSEGGRFHQHGHTSSQFIIGGEYGFRNSLNLLGEYLFTDSEQGDSLALQSGYQLSMLSYGSLLWLCNLADSSGFLAPRLEYSLSDEQLISCGAFIYYGAQPSLYGEQPDRYFINWFIHF